MERNYLKILSAKVNAQPYPHFVQDNVLSAGLLQEVKNNWPDSSFFEPEIRGNYIATLTRSQIAGFPRGQRKFWRQFVRSVSKPMMICIFAKYANYIRARYRKDLRHLEIAAISLMEVDDKFAGHLVHAHHYHDPTWLFTYLIYIDDGGDPTRGTAVHSVKEEQVLNDPRALATVASEVIGGRRGINSPLLKIVKNVEFKPRRLFSFLDSPISYHSVEPAPARGPHCKRKIFRVHIRAPINFIEKLYGVGHQEYRAIRLNQTEPQRILDWLERDIRHVTDVVSPGLGLGGLLYTVRMRFPTFP